MARRKKKQLKFGVALFCPVIFLLVGVLAGFCGKIFLFPDASYKIPQTEQNHSHITAGNIDVNVIKNEELSIHFLELGNKYTGDCTFIKVGDTEILIDAGSRASSVGVIYDYVSEYLSADGVLDYVVVTHAHQDHYAGFATNENTDSLFDLFTVGTVIKFTNTNQKETAKLYSNFLRELNQTKTENGTKVFTAEECYNNTGDAQRIFDLDGASGDVELEILTHKYNESGVKAHSENDYSVCCQINQDGKKYLFTGDLEADGEESLVQMNTLSKVEVYKAGHHGSKTSSSEELLSVIKPSIVCVCCCAGSSEYTSKNENQFPTQEFINRIAQIAQTDAIYVTTLCVDYDKGLFESMNGNIVVSRNKGEANVKVSCANNGLKLKETEWFKNNRTMPVQWVA